MLKIKKIELMLLEKINMKNWVLGYIRYKQFNSLIIIIIIIIIIIRRRRIITVIIYKLNWTKYVNKIPRIIKRNYVKRQNKSREDS